MGRRNSRNRNKEEKAGYAQVCKWAGIRVASCVGGGMGGWRVGHRGWWKLGREKGGSVKEQIWKDILGPHSCDL